MFQWTGVAHAVVDHFHTQYCPQSPVSQAEIQQPVFISHLQHGHFAIWGNGIRLTKHKYLGWNSFIEPKQCTKDWKYNLFVLYHFGKSILACLFSSQNKYCTAAFLYFFSTPAWSPVLTSSSAISSCQPGECSRQQPQRLQAPGLCLPGHLYLSLMFVVDCNRIKPMPTCF